MFSSESDLFVQAVDSHRSGNLSRAVDIYRQVLDRNPRNPDAWGNLGSALKTLGQVDEAEACVRKAISLQSDNSSHHYNLGNTLRELGRRPEAVDAYQQALALNPHFAGAHYNLGLTYEEIGREDDAISAYRAAMANDPAHYESRLNLGALLEAEGRLSEAIELYKQAIAIDPARAPALNNLALALQNAGHPAEAIAIEQQALEKEPHEHRIASNILMTLQYLPGVTDEVLLETARSYGRRFPGQQRLMLVPTTGRKVRIGYVSADLYSHAVGLFLRDVIPRHDREAFEIYCYSNSDRRDDVTATIAANTHWRWIKNASDDAVLAQILEDGIDVLVDLSGHTAQNRLPVFARRAAPVQVSWMGYFATTGVPAMDFVILDPYHAPEGTEGQFTERIIRLPHNRFCYAPATFAPEVAPPPFERNGFITFGSFNNTAKLNDAVLQAWTAILRAVPESRLILKWRTLSDPVYRDQLSAFFRQNGVDPVRVEMRGASMHGPLLEQYGHIDIALDPFPFSGGHTSCEALWMGVPVVTLPQQRVVSRQTWSFLNNIGLPGLAAWDVESYVNLAVRLASEPDTLRELRRTLRDRMRASPLCDGTAFTRQLEGAYRLACETIGKEQAKALHDDAIAAWQAGDAATANAKLEQAIALDPAEASYHANRGVMLKRLGVGEERIACYEKAIELEPGTALYHANLAGALNDFGRYAEGEAAARRALELDPRNAEGWYNFGSSLTRQNRPVEAAAAFDKALECRPGWLDAIKAAADNYRAVANWQAAGARYHDALQRLPADVDSATRVELLKGLGWAFHNLHRYADAVSCYQEALLLAPNDVELLTNLGNIYKAANRNDEARQFYAKVLEQQPGSAGGWCNMGTVDQSQGNYEAAISCFRKAIELDPSLAPVWGNLANCLTYSPMHSPQDVLETYRGFDEHIAKPLLDPRPHANARDPERRLRIGYVSPDFRKHAVAYFALPLIERHDPQQVEVFCYHNHLQEDEWTARFKARADHWLNCVNLDGDQLAERIRADGIDILVDLAGHTENNCLLVFARKPSPVQVTWMGYVTTTGLSAMDWRVTHQDADPQGADRYYSEKLWRLDGTMWCYRPLPDMPEVSPPAFQRKGHITFGSFNRYSKNGAWVLDAWARILQRVPGSHLLIFVPEGQVREETVRFFAERGIDSSRIECFAKIGHVDFWKLHGEIDIALDPFPFGGGTTTCETLWMGVPLVTCTGTMGGVAVNNGDAFPARFASRMGYAFLNNLGLSDLAAETIPEYVDKAVALAQDRERLAAMRAMLRSRMAAAPLTDEVRFAREMEAAYRNMWRVWCSQQGI